jgi:multiple sugar transport system permease protein
MMDTIRRRTSPALLFIVPSAIVIAVFTVWPIIQAFWMSLHEWSFLSQDKPFIGLGNYFALLDDSRFWNALWNTAVYTLAAVPLQIGLALFLAMGLNARLHGRAILRAAYFVPVISSLAVMAIVWSFLFDPDIGLVSSWMANLGLPRIAWLRQPDTAMMAVIIVGVWKTVGFNTVILMAGLQGIPSDHYEAASIDGANAWQKLRRITIPGLRQTLLFVTVISVIASLQVFDQVYVMTRGGPLFATETIVTYLYHQGFGLFRMGYASAISGILFLIIIVISLVQLRIFRYQEVD